MLFICNTPNALVAFADRILARIDRKHWQGLVFDSFLTGKNVPIFALKKAPF
jgi:hypothetical protein